MPTGRHTAAARNAAHRRGHCPQPREYGRVAGVHDRGPGHIDLADRVGCPVSSTEEDCLGNGEAARKVGRGLFFQCMTPAAFSTSVET